MRVLVTGSSGLIGRALLPRLHSAGHIAIPAVRSALPPAGGVAWDVTNGRLSGDALGTGLDAVVHLAGASIAGARWTPARRMLLRDSRVGATARLAAHLASLPRPPRVFIAASGVNFYGDRGEEFLGEECGQGAGFLAQLAADWEAAAQTASAAGARVVSLRLGMVLANGGALARMLPPFKLGLGGRLASGRQWMSWIGIEDVIGMILAALADDRFRGPLNAVSQPVRNAEFTRALAQVLRRPAFFTVPAPALRAVLGPVADEVILASIRAVPRRLTELGYVFQQPALPAALRAALAV